MVNECSWWLIDYYQWWLYSMWLMKRVYNSYNFIQKMSWTVGLTHHCLYQTIRFMRENHQFVGGSAYTCAGIRPFSGHVDTYRTPWHFASFTFTWAYWKTHDKHITHHILPLTTTKYMSYTHTGPDMCITSRHIMWRHVASPYVTSQPATSYHTNIHTCTHVCRQL